MLAAEALGDVAALARRVRPRAGGVRDRPRAACAATPSSAPGSCARRRVVSYRLGAYARAQRMLKAALALLERREQRARHRAARPHRGVARDHHALARPSARVRGAVPACDRRCRVGRRQGGAGARARRARRGLQRARRVAARDEQRPGARSIYQRARRPRPAGRRAQQPRHDRLLRRALERGARPLSPGARGLGSGGRHAQRLAWRASTSARSSRLRAGSTRRSRCCARPSAPAARRAALTDIAESLMETALLEARRGNLERALVQLEEARALQVKTGNETATLLIDARIAEALELGGEYDRAAELAARALERAARRRGECARAARAQPGARAGLPRRRPGRCRARGARAGDRRGQSGRTPLRGSARARRPQPARRRPE